jgi:hypothetical protein
MTDAPDLWGDSYTDAVMTRYIKRRIKTYADVQAAKSVYAKSADAGRPFYTNVTGDCMEGLNIADGDYLLWNPAKRPKAAGDVCLIAAHDKTGLSSKLTLMVKAFHGVYCGQWVRTHYADKPDKTFFVESFGFIAIASACYTADRRLKWKRDISDYPKELSNVRTLDEEPSNVGGFFNILNREVVTV